MEVFEIKHMVRSQIHLLTPEFPPSIGGIASHSQTLADGLREKGHRVFVWCPQYSEIEGDYAGDVRAIPGGFCSNSLLSVGRRIRDEGGIVLLQWVPHGFGLRSYNILFCLWLWQLSKRGVPVYILVHELFRRLSGGVKFFCSGIVHRIMTYTLLQSATKVWASSGAYCRHLLPYMPSRLSSVSLLPSFSSLEFKETPSEAYKLKLLLISKIGDTSDNIVGHFSTFNPMICDKLEDLITKLYASNKKLTFLLIGRGSKRFHQELKFKFPELACRCISTGLLLDEEISLHLQTCDLLLQPCPSGVNARHTSVMSGLANGVPVATYRSWRTERFLNCNKSMILANDEDSENLCRKILALLKFPTKLSEIGRSGKRLYYKRCSKDVVVEHLVKDLVI